MKLDDLKKKQKKALIKANLKSPWSLFSSRINAMNALYHTFIVYYGINLYDLYNITPPRT